MMRSREQSLVNSQVEINRAVFLMNARSNRSHYSLLTEDELSDDAILCHIDDAIKNLQEARSGYMKQTELF